MTKGRLLTGGLSFCMPEFFMNRKVFYARFFVFILFVAALGLLGAQSKKASPAKPSAKEQLPDPLQGSPKVITATKGMTQFWDLENQLAHALAKKDQPVLDQMLPEEFKVWMPNQTGSAVGREDWLAAGKENPTPTQLAQMSVQIYQEVSVVKFIGRGKTPAAGKGQPRQYFVVDTWEKQDSGWGVTNRYMAEIIPIALPKRPTGKE
jgi:hypothetical protein